jgi:hypothetical protein
MKFPLCFFIVGTLLSSSIGATRIYASTERLSQNSSEPGILVAKKKAKRKYKKDKEFEWSKKTKSSSKSSLETNIVGPLFGVLNAEYHIPFGELSTIGGVGYLWGIGSDVSGFGAGGLYTYYLNKLFDGIFVSGGAIFSSLSINETSASGLSLLGLGGYKYNFGEKYSFSGGAGLQYYTFSGSLDGFNAIGFTLLLNIGMYLN